MIILDKYLRQPTAADEMEWTYIMNQCRKPTLADRPWIQKLYEASGYRGAEYTFANLYLWSSYYGEVAEVEGYLCQRLVYRGVHQYLYPAGSGDIRPVLERIIADSRREGKPLVIRSLTHETMEQLESLYPGRFTFTPDRDAYDYLYEIDALADLKGKKLQAKRNHINRFVEAYPDWYTRVITVHNLHVCEKLAERWYESHHESAADRRALTKAFEHFEALEFEGIILYAEEGYPVGFSMGNRISADTFDVNFEKAFADVQGAYPLVNREFARYIREHHPDIRYLNREDDMGIEGLRKAKESYHPIFLEKFIATEKEEAAPC